MKIIARRTSVGQVNEDVLIVRAFEGESPSGAQSSSVLAALDHLTGGAVASIFDAGEMTGKCHSSLVLHTQGQFSTRRLFLYGAGDPQKINPINAARLAGGAIRAAS